MYTPCATPRQIPPGLVFLVVDCNGATTFQAGATMGTLTGSLLGLHAQTDTNAVVARTWPYGALPDPFPTLSPSSYATTAAPLVFLTPF